MKFRSALLALLLLTLPAFAAGQLDSLRQTARVAREQAGTVRSQQMQKRQQLNELSSRIEALKAQSKGHLLSGGELDAALKQSQELSSTLTGLAQTMSGRDSELENANLALLQGLSEQLTGLRADFDRQTNRVSRQQILKQFKALRAEREQVRAALPAAKVPALEALRFSDDPSELLEQADAVRDDEDKVRRELKVLEGRIAEARAERELDTRVHQFLGEESLFDDQDRRLRVRRETLEPAAAGIQAANKAAGLDPLADKTTAGNPPVADFASQDARANPGMPAPIPENGTHSIPTPAGTVRITAGSDSRPTLGGQPLAGGDDEDLEELEVQRLRLQGLAGELHSRASVLDKKAAELK